MVNFGLKYQGYTMPKLDLEAWWGIFLDPLGPPSFVLHYVVSIFTKIYLAMLRLFFVVQLQYCL